MVRRLLLGLIKGVLVGGVIGALLHFGLGVTKLDSWLNYLLYGAVAAMAGIAAGQPPWREGAWVASILKAIFGFGVGAGVYALVSHFLKIPVDGLPNMVEGAQLAMVPLLFAPAVSTVYATLVELDDGGEQAATDKTGVRVSADSAGSDHKGQSAAADQEHKPTSTGRKAER